MFGFIFSMNQGQQFGLPLKVPAGVFYFFDQTIFHDPAADGARHFPLGSDRHFKTLPSRATAFTGQDDH